MDSSPLPSLEPIAFSDPGNHDNSISPSSSYEAESVTSLLWGRGADDVTYPSKNTPAATTNAPPPYSSRATTTQPYTKPPDWLTSVTSLSTTWPVGTTPAPDTGTGSTVTQSGETGRGSKDRKQQGLVGNFMKDWS